MNGLVAIGITAALLIIAAAAKPKLLVEYDIEADEVREGTKNGWYTCVLTVQNGLPAVILSGKMTNGEDYKGVFTISEDDWKELQKEGYQVVEL